MHKNFYGTPSQHFALFMWVPCPSLHRFSGGSGTVNTVKNAPQILNAGIPENRVLSLELRRHFSPPSVEAVTLLDRVLSGIG